MKTAIKTIFTSLLLVPLATRAATDFGPVEEFIDNIGSFINGYLIPLVFALALLVFIYGMFTYFILGGGDEQKRTQGKALIIWGIIGFVMMVVILGVVNLFANGLRSGIGNTAGDGDLNTLPTGPVSR